MPDPETPQNPVLAEVWRGPVLECVHRGTAVVCRPNGAIVAEWGDPARRILPRSALKPLQALPLIESGASFRAELTPRHLALACASHNGAEEHTGLVTEWLEALGLGEDDLRCGSQMPNDEEAGRRLIAAREAPGQIHNNCSGKHAGMLTLNRHVGGDAEYLEPEHPVQKMIRQAISEICDEEITEWAVDGCSAPNWVMSLKGLATAMARFAHPGLMGPVRGPAAARLRNAMAAHPSLVAGQGRSCTALIEACEGRAVVKTGAEGGLCRHHRRSRPWHRAEDRRRRGARRPGGDCGAARPVRGAGPGACGIWRLCGRAPAEPPRHRLRTDQGGGDAAGIGR